MDDQAGWREATWRGVRMAQGVITLGMVVLAFLAFLAFDDITTDNATSFTFEYAFLLVIAIWSLILGVSLVAMKHFFAGGVSVLVLAAGVWGQRSVGPGTIPSWEPGYVATVAAHAWFLALALWLLVSGLMPGRRGSARRRASARNQG